MGLVLLFILSKTRKKGDVGGGVYNFYKWEGGGCGGVVWEGWLSNL